MKKIKQEDNSFVPDPYLLQLFQNSVDTFTESTNRAEQYLRVEQIKLEIAKEKLKIYQDTGVILKEEELRKKHGLVENKK